MSRFFSASKRGQSRGEEIANSLSHGLGLIASLVAAPFLVLHAVRQGDAGFIAGASIFAATMVLLYLASTLYHALPTGHAKRVFRVIEHSAIFLLIAGTYTPFTLGVLNGIWGWTLAGRIFALMRGVFACCSHPFATLEAPHVSTRCAIQPPPVAAADDPYPLGVIAGVARLISRAGAGNIALVIAAHAHSPLGVVPARD